MQWGQTFNSCIFFIMRELHIGARYRHFKGKEYRVEGIATDSETLEPMVIYRPLYGEGGLWVRPLTMFLEQVDRNKYPDAQQKYRFEEILEDKEE